MPSELATDALRVKLAEIGASIRATKHRLKVLMGDRQAVATALRLLETDTDWKPNNIPPGLRPGSFTRSVLDVLRLADTPLSPRQIAERLAKERAGRVLEPKELDHLIKRVRRVVPRVSDQLEGKLRERTTYWRVKIH